MTITGILLARRRLDTALLATGFALVGFFDIATKLIFLFFIGAGFYLACRRHRTVRFAPAAFSLALLAFGLWPIVLGLARGEPIEDNRQFVYSLLALGFVFFPAGIGLVGRPLGAAVCGARLGAVALTVLAVADFGLNGGRVGLWGNEALFAFLVAISGILGRIPLGRLPRFVPSGTLCFYLSAIPAVLSQTRAAWFAYLAAAVLDGARLVMGRRTKPLPSTGWIVAMAAVVCIALVPAAQIVGAGLETGLAQFSTFSRAQAADTSVGIRMSMWQGAAEVFGEHPILGVGATTRIGAVADKMPESRSVLLGFKHLHNLFLDEALSHGVIGLGLMLAVFATFLVEVWKRTRNAAILQTSGLIVLLVVTFGQFHGVMLNETTLMAIYGSLMAILVGIPREPGERPVPAGGGRSKPQGL